MGNIAHSAARIRKTATRQAGAVPAIRAVALAAPNRILSDHPDVRFKMRRCATMLYRVCARCHPVGVALVDNLIDQAAMLPAS
jgi:hypothetical protein